MKMMKSRRIPGYLCVLWQLGLASLFFNVGLGLEFETFGLNSLSDDAQFIYVTGNDLNNGESISKIMNAIEDEYGVLFENIENGVLRNILEKSNFPTYPNNEKEYYFIHKYRLTQYQRPNYMYHTAIYEKFSILKTNSNNNNNNNNKETKTAKTLKNNKKQSKLFETFKNDIFEYIDKCVPSSTSSLSDGTQEDNNKFCINWNSKYKDDVSNIGDQSGMMPTNDTAVWGYISQTLYIDNGNDNSGDSTFESVIPYSFYIYAQANPATLELDSIVLYIISEGLHKTSPQCDSDTCRGCAHRQLWVNCTAYPSNVTNNNVNPETYHWIYSRPSTENNEASVTTSVSDSITLGMSGSIKNGMSFSHSYEWTNGYSESVSIDEFGVNEDTDPITAIGQWYYFQQLPFNIMDNEPWNFASDWTSWYSSTETNDNNNNNNYGGCVIEEGPDLAFNSQQTSNAIRWSADESLIDYTNKQFNINYSVNLAAEVDIVWCPNDPSNINPGHHEIEYWMIKSNEDYTANVIQAMNNIN